MPKPNTDAAVADIIKTVRYLVKILQRTMHSQDVTVAADQINRWLDDAGARLEGK